MSFVSCANFKIFKITVKETLEHSFLITNTNKEAYEDHINIKRTNICINWMEIAPLSQVNYEVVIVSFTT